MKSVKEKLWFGYMGISAALTLLMALLSLWWRVDWYYYLVTPSYLYGQLLLAGMAVGDWGQILLAAGLMGATIGGVFLRWKGERKWSSMLVITPLSMHTLVQLFRVWNAVPYMTWGEWLELLPYGIVLVLNGVLFGLYWFNLRKQ